MEPEDLGREDPGGELRTWRGVVVPVLGPLWVLLPFCIWLICFGSALLDGTIGSSGWWIPGAVALLAFTGWAALAGARLMHACQAGASDFPWGLVVRTGVILILQMFVGAVFLAVVLHGMLKEHPPLLRALIGACLVVLAWMGWSGITPHSRRLALGYLRLLRKKA